MLAFEIITTGIQAGISWTVTIGAFAYIGYTVKKKGATTGEAAKHGAFAGVVTGFVGAVLSIGALYVFPQIYADAIEKAVAQGAPRETMETFMRIGVYFGLLTGPIISALIGSAISAVSGALTKK